MGVKSTVFLTREEAEEKYKDLYVQICSRPNPFNDKELEDLLEEMNDMIHDGEGFENYIIEGEKE